MSLSYLRENRADSCMSVLSAQLLQRPVARLITQTIACIVIKNIWNLMQFLLFSQVIDLMKH